ncbi:alpha/beta hydrolase fold domain-containing protein [Sinorhizobium medicae]|nr:alpha/beta hydrolase fold domain-containing protein [Sinorhizobium medicae]
MYLDFHGGAWVMGNARFNDRVNSAIAAECQTVVASVEYRLARDDRIRPSIEDALAATGWILENMQSEFGVDRVFLGGESSGAHLAACAYGAVRPAGRSILRRGRGLILRHLRHGRHSEPEELFGRSAYHAWSVRPSKSHATDLGNGRRAAPIPLSVASVL